MVASSRHRFCSTSAVRFTTVTSITMSYWCTVTYASAYTGSLNPVSCSTLLSLRSSFPAPPSLKPVARLRSVATASSSSTCDKPLRDLRW